MVTTRIKARGVPPSLAAHELFTTQDLAEATAQLGKVLAPAFLVSADPENPDFAVSMHGLRLHDISLLYLDIRGGGTIVIAHSGPYYAVHLPMNGLASGTCAGQAFEASPIRAVVTNPVDPVTLTIPADSPQIIIKIEQDAMIGCLTRMLGRAPGQDLHFDASLDLASEAANRWHSVATLLQTEIYYSGSLTSAGLGVSALEDFLMSTLLLQQPSSCRELLLHGIAAPGRRTVRRAMDYIEHHLAEPIAMQDLADHVGASVRSIQQGFHEELHISPVAYIRGRRLERVHAQLVDGQRSEGVTVAEVAENWGFHQLGSFAGMYRERWGESPSETLRH